MRLGRGKRRGRQEKQGGIYTVPGSLRASSFIFQIAAGASSGDISFRPAIQELDIAVELRGRANDGPVAVASPQPSMHSAYVLFV